ncbi:MAG: mechanosensitive ion channel [Bdellovibrionota bacterium]
MFQNVGNIKEDLKDVVDPRFVKQEIQSSWVDFWNFEVLKDASGASVTVGVLIIAVVCFVVGIICARWLSRKLVKLLFARMRMTPATLHIWTTITFYVSCLLVTIVALKIAHVPLTIFTFMGGALALGLGFGSKNLVNNFISGLIFMFEGPAKMGDFIEADGYFGRVESVGIRATQLQLGLNRRVIIPNSSLLEKSLVNWGQAGNPVYMSIAVGVAYESDLQKVEKILLEMPKGVSQVIENLPSRVFLSNFGDSSVDLSLSFAVELYSPADRDIITSEVRKKIFSAFTEQGVVIPFPQRVLHSSPGVKALCPS